MRNKTRQMPQVEAMLCVVVSTNAAGKIGIWMRAICKSRQIFPIAGTESSDVVRNVPFAPGGRFLH